MTFSAPKSVSVLFAVGDEQLSGALVEAHEEAVDAALAYMEHGGVPGPPRAQRHEGRAGAGRSARLGAGALGARRGVRRGGVSASDEAGAGPAAAHARRRGEHGAGGGWAVDGAVTRATSTSTRRRPGRCTRRICGRRSASGSPWAQWGAMRNGMAELEQIPAGVMEEFSTRRQQILERGAELQAAGVVLGDEGRQRVDVSTPARRSTRSTSATGATWIRRSRRRARARADELAELLARPAAARGGRARRARARGTSCSAPAGLTATQQHVRRRRDVVIAVAAAHAQGATAGEVLAIADRMLQIHARSCRSPAHDGRCTAPASCSRPSGRSSSRPRRAAAARRDR